MFPTRIAWYSSVVLLTAAAPFVLACGGGDDFGDEIRIGSDEAYVRAACEAQNEFFGDLLSILFTEDELDDEERLEVMRDPLKDFRKRVAEARPPEDAVAYHRALLAGIDSLSSRETSSGLTHSTSSPETPSLRAHV